MPIVAAPLEALVAIGKPRLRMITWLNHSRIVQGLLHSGYLCILLHTMTHGMAVNLGFDL